MTQPPSPAQAWLAARLAAIPVPARRLARDRAGRKRHAACHHRLGQLWRFNPRLVVWGLSATLGNLQEAMEVLCHPGLEEPAPDPDPGGSISARQHGLRVKPAMTPCLVRGRIEKDLIIDTLAKRHRLGIGTIVSDASMQVKYMSGASIGTIEEGFIARLRKGDCFFFAGKLLEFVRVHEMAAYVRKATRHKGTVPTWQGSKMALSTELGDAVLEMMQRAAQGDFFEPELEAARPMLQTQARLSRIPTPHTILVETFRSREGCHLYVYPFAGRHVHLGLASLLAWRLARERPNTFSMSVEVLSQELEISRLRATLVRLARKTLDVAELRHPSPMSLPLMVERFREQLTTEQLSSRLDRILKEMERDAASA